MQSEADRERIQPIFACRTFRDSIVHVCIGEIQNLSGLNQLIDHLITDVMALGRKKRSGFN